jgi:hypothetical protein
MVIADSLGCSFILRNRDEDWLLAIFRVTFLTAVDHVVDFVY